MDRVEKYKAYFTAQAAGKFPRQRGGISLNKVLEWTKKACDLASVASKIVSPVQQVTDQVKSSLRREQLNTTGSGLKNQNVRKRCSKNTYKGRAHKLVKRSRK
jgi:hypothetical protein